MEVIQIEEHAEITKQVEGEMRDKLSVEEGLRERREWNEKLYNF